MYNEWSLEIFYKGIDDPALTKDLTTLEGNVAAYKKLISELSDADVAKTLREIIDLKESTAVLVRKLAGYCSLRRSTNSLDRVCSSLP